jgi:putative membrane protein
MSCSTQNSKSCCSTNSCSLIKLVTRWAVLALGVFVAAHTSKGIAYDTNQTLAVVVLVLSLLNLFLRPLLVLLTLPFVVLTGGLGLWLINAGLLMLTAKFVAGFQVAGFWSALWASLVMSAMTLLVGVVGARMGGNCGGKCSGNCKCKSKKDQDAIDIDQGPGSCC